MRTVLITGCNGGIGSAICSKFKKEGWYVIGLDIVDDDKYQSINKFYQCDLSSKMSIDHVVEQMKNRLDCIINNAAVQICKPIHETSYEEMNYVMNINVVAPFYLVSKLLSKLIDSCGSVVNIGSVHATSTSSSISAYGTSKAGIVGLTRSLAIELSSYGIRVNSVSPGAIDTPMLRQGLLRNKQDNVTEDELFDQLTFKHPLQRVGTPEEVAESVYFLADNKKSPNTTGANLVVDGGALIKLSTE